MFKSVTNGFLDLVMLPCSTELYPTVLANATLSPEHNNSLNVVQNAPHTARLHCALSFFFSKYINKQLC